MAWTWNNIIFNIHVFSEFGDKYIWSFPAFNETSCYIHMSMYCMYIGPTIWTPREWNRRYHILVWASRGPSGCWSYVDRSILAFYIRGRFPLSHSSLLSLLLFFLNLWVDWHLFIKSCHSPFLPYSSFHRESLIPVHWISAAQPFQCRTISPSLMMGKRSIMEKS